MFVHSQSLIKLLDQESWNLFIYFQIITLHNNKDDSHNSNKDSLYWRRRNFRKG